MSWGPWYEFEQWTCGRESSSLFIRWCLWHNHTPLMHKIRQDPVFPIHAEWVVSLFLRRVSGSQGTVNCYGLDISFLRAGMSLKCNCFVFHTSKAAMSLLLLLHQELSGLVISNLVGLFSSVVWTRFNSYVAQAYSHC